MLKRMKPQLTLSMFTVVVLALVVFAVALSAWAFGIPSLGAKAEPQIASAEISVHGGSCTLALTNAGKSAAVLNEVLIQYTTFSGQTIVADSYAPPGTTVQPGQTVNYDCSQTGEAPFLPFVSSTANGPYVLTAYFEGGLPVQSSGVFSGQ